MATKAVHSIVDKMDHFDGWDDLEYIWIFAREMKLNKVLEDVMI